MGLACISAVWCVAIPWRIRGSVSRMDCGVAVSTAAEQEAARLYPWGSNTVRGAFVAGWNECESRHRELLEAAREYRDGGKEYDVAWADLQAHFNDPAYSDAVQRAYWKRESGETRLLAAAAALDEEGGE